MITFLLANFTFLGPTLTGYYLHVLLHVIIVKAQTGLSGVISYFASPPLSKKSSATDYD